MTASAKDPRARFYSIKDLLHLSSPLPCHKVIASVTLAILPTAYIAVLQYGTVLVLQTAQC